MDETQNDFSPLLIDQQIDNPNVLLSPEGAQVVHEVRALFEQEISAGIERGWSRLINQRTNAPQPSEALDSSVYRQRRERISTMQEHMLSSTPQQNTPRRPVSRLFGLIAAVLVCGLLVGSLALVLTATKRTAPPTTLGNPKSPTSVPTPTPTPLVIPPACKDTQDLADEVLCAEGQETTLNITRQFSITLHNPNSSANGTGTINVTFLRAYVDPVRLMLVYNINQAPDAGAGDDWGGFATLSTSQGDLGSHGSGLWKGFYVQSFDTSRLPTGIPQVQVQTIHTIFGKSIPLAFALPFHAASKTIQVEQSFSQKGYTLTLDHVVLTGSTAVLAYAYTMPSPQGFIEGKVQNLVINGRDQDLYKCAGTEGGNQTGGNGQMDCYQSLLGHSGIWKVTLALVQIHFNNPPGSIDTPVVTATFTFTV